MPSSFFLSKASDAGRFCLLFPDINPEVCFDSFAAIYPISCYIICCIFYIFLAYLEKKL